MRFDGIRIRGLGPFREEVDVDLAALDARLVAVTGGNGAGKSTLLELLAASLYRQCPTRGSLASLATRRDALVEARVVNGQPYTVRQLVDAHTGKGEAVIMDGEGQALTDSGKLKEADAFVSRHIPPPEVLYASTFAAQGSGGFLEMKPAERKRVLLRVLGIERLEAMADRARERAREAKGRLETLRARIDDARAGALDVEEAAARVVTAREGVREADEGLEQARARLAALEEEARAADQQARELLELAERRRSLGGQVEELRTRLAETEYRQRQERAVLERAAEIRAAVARDRELVDEERRLDEERRAAIEALDEAKAEVSKLEADARGLRSRMQDAERWAGRAKTALEGAEEVEKAQRELPEAEEALRQAESAVQSMEDEIQKQRDELLHGKDRRIDGLRAGLDAVMVAHEMDAYSTAERALYADDEAQERQAALPDAIERQVHGLPDARADVVDERSRVQRLQRLADRAPAIEQARKDLEAARRDHGEAADELAAIEAKHPQAHKLLEERAAVLREKKRLQGEAVSERSSLEHLTRHADELARAEATLAALEPEAERERAALAKAQADLEALPVPVDPPPVPDTRPAREAVELAERRSREAHGALAVAERAAEQAQEVGERIRGLEEERREVEGQLADWTRLAQDLGRDGLQALEIDAAGPELTELVNDLLRSCHGSRFSVAVQTTRLSADGKRELEGCDVIVTDTVRGREAEAGTFSGGERVIIGEAVSLALSVLACRRAGVDRPTLIRDESGAALDPENGRAWIAMLRRSADLIGADKVLFVAHNPELQELADARLVVADGRVEVQA